MWTYRIAKRARSKPRPRVTKTGHTYMPPEFQQWREEVGWLMKAGGMRPVKGPVEVHLTFYGHGFDVTIIPLSGSKRAKYVTGDVDNLIGGVLEVLEDIGIVKNDRDVHRVIATVADNVEEE